MSACVPPLEAALTSQQPPAPRVDQARRLSGVVGARVTPAHGALIGAAGGSIVTILVGASGSSEIKVESAQSLASPVVCRDEGAAVSTRHAGPG